MSKVASNFYTISATTENEHKIFYRLYVPDDNQIVATILLVHGMQEHSGRYEELANYLTTQNFAVLTYDQLGHGKTALDADQLGYFKQHGAKEQLIDDAITMSNFLEKNISPTASIYFRAFHGILCNTLRVTEKRNTI